MQIITATSWNGKEFYYNTHTRSFDQADKVDLSGNDHYESDEHTIPFAEEVAAKHDLKRVKLEIIENV